MKYKSSRDALIKKTVTMADFEHSNISPVTSKQIPKSSKYVYFIVFVVNLMALVGGLSIGWTSPVLQKLTNPNRTDENPLGHVISENEESWITAMLTLGPAVGTYPFGILSDRIGRRWTLIVSGFPMCISYVTLALAKSISLILFARFFIGVAFAAIVSILFVYIGEIADVKNRGKLLSFYNNFLTFGLLLSYIFGAYFSIMIFNFIAAAIPALFLCLFFIFGLESPVYLLKKNKRPEACEILKKLRVGSDVKAELDVWELEIKTSQEGTIKDLLSDRVLVKGLTITIALVVFQQFSGIGAVLSYAESIFEAAGSSLPTEISAIIIGAIQFIASFTTPFFVDRAGRKILFIISASGMIVTQTALGIYFYINDNTDIDTESISWLPVLVLVIFIIVYNTAFGVLPYTVAGEIFPSNVRSPAVATTGLMNSLAGFLISLLFKKMTGSILGNAGTFWIFAGFCVLALLFLIFFVPETKGKTLEEIHNKLRK